MKLTSYICDCCKEQPGERFKYPVGRRESNPAGESNVPDIEDMVDLCPKCTRNALQMILKCAHSSFMGDPKKYIRGIMKEANNICK